MITLLNGRLEAGGVGEGEKCLLCGEGNADYFFAHLDPFFVSSLGHCRRQRLTEGQSSEQAFDIRSHFWPGMLRSSRGFHSHI